MEVAEMRVFEFTAEFMSRRRRRRRGKNDDGFFLLLPAERCLSLLLLPAEHCLSLLLLLLLLLLDSSSRAVAQTARPVAINCGSSQSFTDPTSLREWQADLLANTDVGMPAFGLNQSESPKNAKEDGQVYKSARIFFESEGNYTVNCVAGTSYFVRLFFNAFSKSNTSHSLLSANFSVSVGDVGLLNNWSISSEVDGKEDSALMKEYGTACPPSAVLTLRFIPSGSGSFAFVNGFEFFPMSEGLYRNITKAGYSFATFYRWNCGGGLVPSSGDLLRRRWAQDVLASPGGQEYSSPAQVKRSNEAPTFTPAAVFKSARLAPPPLVYNLPVERRAHYFVRLLFAELQFRNSYERVMTVQINGQVRLQRLDVVVDAGASEGTFRDFMPIEQPWNMPNLTIALQKEARAVQDGMAINGLEVLKIGLTDLWATETVRLTKGGGLEDVGNREAAGILRQFLSTSPGNDNILADWNTNAGVCTWRGVECGPSPGGEVIGLYMTNFSGVGGQIPEGLGDLSSLKTLVLSNQRLEGPIPTSLGKLTQLETLLISGNILTGGIPKELATANRLRTLEVEKNNLTGRVPSELLNILTRFTWRSEKNSLCAAEAVSRRFSLPVCGEGGGGSGRRSVQTIVAIGLGTVGGFVLLTAVVFIFCVRRDTKAGRYILDSFTGSYYSSKGKSGGMFSGTGLAGGKGGANATTMMMDGKQVGQRFSFAEIGKATCQFDETRIIGMGGFGNVYRGELADGELVAVKRGSAESRQGAREFQTEIVTLSKVRHRHLVSLIGYCDDDGEMILVYEFMAKGTLRGHLYGKGVDSITSPLTWRKRLEICIGAARGLEYLHSGAQDMVIHRDVKSTNILLDDDLVAKVADFGLSKSGPSGINETHVSTAVKGSFGYLDPAYFKTQQLTEKSDVYSFGVVLLEIITARAAIMQGGSVPAGQQTNLADWALPYVQAGKVEQIVDPKLVNSYGTASLHKVAEVALRCLDDNRDARPSMADVVRGLEDALMLQDNSLSVVLDNPAAMMSTCFYNQQDDNSLRDFSTASGATYPPSPPESLLMAR